MKERRWVESGEGGKTDGGGTRGSEEGARSKEERERMGERGKGDRIE